MTSIEKKKKKKKAKQGPSNVSLMRQISSLLVTDKVYSRGFELRRLEARFPLVELYIL